MQKFNTVDEFLDSLDEDKKAQVLKLREWILSCSSGLTEHIKWNAPSYVYEGEDRITFSLLNKQNVVKLVLRMGATRKEDKKGKPVLNDKFSLIEWASNIRGYITFTDLDDVVSREKAVKQLIIEWLNTV